MELQVEQMSKQLSKGQKVFLTNHSNEVFEGFFNRLNISRSSITLRNVTSITDGRNFDQLEFDLEDVRTCSTLSENKPSETEAPCSGKPSQGSTDNPYHLTAGIYEKIKKRVQDHVYLDKIDDHFFKAMKDIWEYQTIAVSGEDSHEGRSGRIAILGLATPHKIYLIDTIALGERAFTAAKSTLKVMLESEEVLKVVHDCRLLSDCLFHKYKVRLANVFDTQVCHSTVVRNAKGIFPSSAAAFTDLVEEFLKLPSGFTEVADSVSWKERPISTAMLDVAAWRVGLLITLKRGLENALFAPFENWCKLYVNIVRESESFDAREHVGRSSHHPKEMTALDKQLQL